MTKYNYTYIKESYGNPDYTRLLTIIKEGTTIQMLLSEYEINDNGELIPKKDHQTLINIFDYNIVKLEKYVDYLGDDSSRIFDLNEILNIVNN
jgi:uncharacterized protein YfbU (UPF0304 family)